MWQRIVWFSLLGGVGLPVGAQSVTSPNLLSHLKQYDGQRVTYEGEVVQDLMRRGGYGWANVSDGQNALGVWAPAQALEAIQYTGSYRFRGDWVRVTGVFHAACPQHGGDVDLHADRLQVIAPGGPTPHPVSAWEAIGAMTALALTIGLMVWTHRIERARRPPEVH